MKRTWMVTVGSSAGHEECGMLDFMETYGPYTKQQAEDLASSLEVVLRGQGAADGERLEAVAHPLDCRSPSAVLKAYREGSAYLA